MCPSYGTVLLFFGENLCNLNYYPICGSSTWDYSSWPPHLYPSYLSYCFYCFISLAVEDFFFLLVFQSFSSVLVVNLVCPWKEMSSGSSYPAVLTTLPLLIWITNKDQKLDIWKQTEITFCKIRRWNILYWNFNYLSINSVTKIFIFSLYTHIGLTFKITWFIY